MLSETIAHLTRKIAEELDSLSDRKGQSSPQEVADEDTTHPESRELPGDSEAPESNAEMDAPRRSPARPRSLRDVLSWRRFKVN